MRNSTISMRAIVPPPTVRMRPMSKPSTWVIASRVVVGVSANSVIVSSPAASATEACDRVLCNVFSNGAIMSLSEEMELLCPNKCVHSCIERTPALCSCKRATYVKAFTSGVVFELATCHDPTYLGLWSVVLQEKWPRQVAGPSRGEEHARIMLVRTGSVCEGIHTTGDILVPGNDRMPDPQKLGSAV
jgi:hypothetical protein